MPKKNAIDICKPQRRDAIKNKDKHYPPQFYACLRAEDI